jgi:Polysaccharide lyase
MRRMSFFSLVLSGMVLSASVVLTLGASKSHPEIIDSVTKDIRQARGREYAGAKGGAACNQLQNVPFPDRSRRNAFQHVVDRCGERSELRMQTTKIGKTYWYGWSIFIPSDWKDTDAGHDMLSQWATYPNVNSFRKACGAVGSFLARGRNGKRSVGGGSVDFFLQHAGDSAAVECQKFPLAKVSELQGKWVDFVMHVKWTGNKDGFLKLWMKSGNEPYAQKIDYQGRTYFNNEGKGPYFKMGLYKGDPNWKGSTPRTLYTAEYRLGNEKSSFAEVAPKRISGFCKHIPWLCQ